MCGTSLPDGTDFCPNCGTDLRQFKQQPADAVQQPVDTEQQPADKEPQQISAESTTPMMDIPIADAPDEVDPESGTTVLTADMSGPLTSTEAPQGFTDTNTADPFASATAEPVAPTAVSEQLVAEDVKQHQPQAPEGKVVTPAPVTGSSILSDDSVAPVIPTVPAQPLPQAQNVSNSFNQENNFARAEGQQYNQNPYMSAGGQGVTVINQMGSGAIPEDYKPISPWGYIGYTLIFSIPIVGLIMMFVWGFGATNKNLKNFARSYLIIMLISVVLSIIILLISAITGAAILGGLSDY